MLHILGMDREKIGKKGVLVVDVSKDSFLGASIKKDDVITHFYIPDIFSGESNSLDPRTYMSNFDCSQKFERAVCAELDNHGQITAYKTAYPRDIAQHNTIVNNLDTHPPVQAGRRMTMVEVIDVIPTGCTISAVVWRKGQKEPHLLPCTYQCSTQHIRIPRVYWNWEPMDWEIALGMCMVPLSTNLIDYFSDCSESSDCNNLQRFKDWDNMFDKRVVITNIFANTDTFNLQCVHLGDTIKTLEIWDQENRSVAKLEKVETLEQIRALPWHRGMYVSVETSSKTRLGLYLPESLQQDKEVCQAYSIQCTPFMERLHGSAPRARARARARAAPAPAPPRPRPRPPSQRRKAATGPPCSWRSN